jgi:hypothetical protein
MKLFLSSLFLLTLNSCSEYWWTRGQPPASSEILSRAKSRVIEVHQDLPSERPEIYLLADSLSSEFNIITSEDTKSKQLSGSFSKIEEALYSLEGKLSYGNRAPLQELSGQFRALKEKGLTVGFENLPKESLKLFGARVLFMLSSEMKVPAPDAIAAS